MSLVVDSSVALSWCFEDERPPVALALLDRVVEAGAVAPGLFPLEVLNGLVMAERRGRLDAVRRQQMTGFLRDLPITLDAETAAQAWTTTAHLADTYRLTLYDAAYLELAQRLALPLATFDQALGSAAAQVGVTWLGS